MDDRLRIALLIDADNASSGTLEYVLEEIANLGVANVRRAYGDWGSGYLKPWRDALLENAIQPLQQIAYSKKGNASDMAMIIDAMDLLYTGRFDAFALMSSDSDFTPLAMRLRAANMLVFGFGKSQTPNAFKAACSTFFHVDNTEEPPLGLLSEKEGTQSSAIEAATITQDRSTSVYTLTSGSAATAKVGAVPTQPPKKRSGAELRGDTALVNLLRGATEAAKGEDGWSHLGAIGNHINNRGSFTPKNYGYKTLKPLILATELFALHPEGNHIKALPPKHAKKKPSENA
ncbi:MAG: NYN domain-containing protein [Lysobacter sp.]|nr:MAG: NYN domain-containing protein [Lysobacter sp.]